ncbi:MAG: hypothetical protein IT160_15260 [Bryobacterales bacterium]|nr:hypothetical protein [Bryobacterales bacterium]
MRISPALLCLITALSAAGAPPAELLASQGAARAVIVVDDQSGPFYRWIAGELVRYIEAISGARLPVETTATYRSQGGKTAILLGGPSANRLTRETARASSVRFEDLKTDGFLLKTVHRNGAPLLVAGGNDEASTMYAAYELLERLGVTFLAHTDILPEKSATLALPTLDLRVETPFPRRGFLISNIYPNRGIWSLDEVKRFLDRMARMKMNYLQFFWFEHEPWINFGFRGENKLLGDATGPETGYLTWRYNYGSYLVKDLAVGKELFGGRKKMAPAEFQNVETPEQAFRTAKAFLNEIIRYAKTRKIKVWLCVDPTTLPGNLARFATRAANYEVPFHPILGTHMCPADPELHEMNENRLRALVETYPEAEGYFLYIPEMFPDCKDALNRRTLKAEAPKFDGLIKLWQPYTSYERDPKVVVESNAGSVYIVRKMIEARDRIAPHAKVGIGGIGRGFLLPYLDKLFPKSIPFTDMESRAIWTAKGVPMEYFGGMGDRERTLVPRMDDDNDMFGPQFNLNLYYKDRMLEGSLENGVAGFAGQLNRVRGTEQNTRYLAEGAWKPHLTPDAFYDEYARRIFGQKAHPEMMAAFRKLEENEEYMGWIGRSNFNCCGVLPEVSVAYHLYRQPNPYDGPLNTATFMSNNQERIDQFERSRELLGQALAHLDRAAPLVAPRGRTEIAFLRNRTESYRMLLDTLATARRGYVAFNEAFRLRSRMPYAEFQKRLDASMALFTEARKKGRATTEKFAGFMDHDSDLGVLYRANLFLVTGLELVEQTMEDLVNFHHGRPYTRAVAWEKIYPGFPTFGRPRVN